MIERVVSKYDLIYRLIGLSQAIGLGATTLLSLPSSAATTNYVASALHVSKDIFGVVALVLGLIVVLRRWSFWSFFVLMFPLIIYAFANMRYSYVAQLTSTVPALLLFAGLTVLLVVRYGFKALK